MIKSTYRFVEHSLLANMFTVAWLFPALIILLAVTLICLPLVVISWLPVVMIGWVDDKIRGTKHLSSPSPPKSSNKIHGTTQPPESRTSF